MCSVVNVGEFRVGEESTHDLRCFLQVAECAEHDVLEFVNVLHDGAGDVVVLDVLVHPLVGVEFRGVRWQEERSYSACGQREPGLGLFARVDLVWWCAGL